MGFAHQSKNKIPILPTANKYTTITIIVCGRTSNFATVYVSFTNLEIFDIFISNFGIFRINLLLPKIKTLALAVIGSSSAKKKMWGKKQNFGIKRKRSV